MGTVKDFRLFLSESARSELIQGFLKFCFCFSQDIKKGRVNMVATKLHLFAVDIELVIKIFQHNTELIVSKVTVENGRKEAVLSAR